MNPKDIWRAANLLIKQHGQDAAIYASERADELLERGDVDGRAVWLRIHAELRELLREQPEDGETVQ